MLISVPGTIVMFDIVYRYIIMHHETCASQVNIDGNTRFTDNMNAPVYIEQVSPTMKVRISVSHVLEVVCMSNLCSVL